MLLESGANSPCWDQAMLASCPALSPRCVCARARVCVCVFVFFQVLDYGYIPNAVPEEGGKCS